MDADKIIKRFRANCYIKVDRTNAKTDEFKWNSGKTTRIEDHSGQMKYEKKGDKIILFINNVKSKYTLDCNSELMVVFNYYSSKNGMSVEIAIKNHGSNRIGVHYIYAIGGVTDIRVIQHEYQEKYGYDFSNNTSEELGKRIQIAKEVIKKKKFKCVLDEPLIEHYLIPGGGNGYFTVIDFTGKVEHDENEKYLSRMLAIPYYQCYFKVDGKRIHKEIDEKVEYLVYFRYWSDRETGGWIKYMSSEYKGDFDSIKTIRYGRRPEKIIEKKE